MKARAPSSADPLPNPRHEAFAREVASGRNATQAYLNVYGSKSPSRRVASTGGHRIMRRKGVAARIKAIQQAGAAGVALDLQEIHEFLTRVVRTPAGMIIPSSDLCTRVKHTRDGATDVWMPDKLACLRLSAKLQGFLDTTRLAQTARLAQPGHMAQTDSPAQFEPTKQPITADTDVRIMTEERRAILMAKKRAVVLRRLKQAEEERLAEEQRSVTPERPNQDHQSGQNPTHKPPVASAPPQAAPAQLDVGCWALRRSRPEFDEGDVGCFPTTPTTPPVPPKPPAKPAPPAHLAWAAYPVSANSARPIHPASCTMRPPSPHSAPVPAPTPRHHPPHPTRVDPRSSSQIVII